MATFARSDPARRHRPGGSSFVSCFVALCAPHRFSGSAAVPWGAAPPSRAPGVRRGGGDRLPGPPAAWLRWLERNRRLAVALLLCVAAGITVQQLTPAPAYTVSAFAAARDLPAGETLGPEDLTLLSVPREPGARRQLWQHRFPARQAACRGAPQGPAAVRFPAPWARPAGGKPSGICRRAAPDGRSRLNPAALPRSARQRGHDNRRRL